jgi:deoxyribonuclease V
MEIKQLHSWKVNTAEASKIQIDLREKLILHSESKFSNIQTIAAADVSCNKFENILYTAVVVVRYADLQIINSFSKISYTSFPYIPGFLSFREAPAVLDIFSEISDPPDVLICDGQGIAHPRGLGLASHLGLLLNLPTIGCAKSILVGKYREPALHKGNHSPLIHQGQIVGVALRSRSNVKSIFVSSGYKIELQDAVQLVLHTCQRYRIPEPLRIAHRLVNEMRTRNHK